jgi:hypothetical protein
MKKIKCLLLFLFIALTLNTWAQETESSGLKDKIEARRVSFITQRLDLSPAESQVFWPTYNQYRKELEAVRKSKKEIIDVGIKNMTDSEISKMLEDGLAAEQKELDIKRKYYNEFKKAISARKIAKLYKAEKEFIKIVLDEFYNNKSR